MFNMKTAKLISISHLLFLKLLKIQWKWVISDLWFEYTWNSIVQFETGFTLKPFKTWLDETIEKKDTNFHVQSYFIWYWFPNEYYLNCFIIPGILHVNYRSLWFGLVWFSLVRFIIILDWTVKSNFLQTFCYWLLYKLFLLAYKWANIRESGCPIHYQLMLTYK